MWLHLNWPRNLLNSRSHEISIRILFCFGLEHSKTGWLHRMGHETCLSHLAYYFPSQTWHCLQHTLLSTPRLDCPSSPNGKMTLQVHHFQGPLYLGKRPSGTLSGTRMVLDQEHGCPQMSPMKVGEVSNPSPLLHLGH